MCCRSAGTRRVTHSGHDKISRRLTSVNRPFLRYRISAVPGFQATYRSAQFDHARKDGCTARSTCWPTSCRRTCPTPPSNRWYETRQLSLVGSPHDPRNGTLGACCRFGDNHSVLGSRAGARLLRSAGHVPSNFSRTPCCNMTCSVLACQLGTPRRTRRGARRGQGNRNLCPRALRTIFAAQADPH